jgi:hypothetical protein
MQQATVNLFAEMGVQPESLQDDLALATADTIPPVSSIMFPTNGSTVFSGGQIVIFGNSTDDGGAVAGVQVSTDGFTWNNGDLNGTSWSYDWIPGWPGQAIIMSRAYDDVGNVESGGSMITVGIIDNPDTTTPPTEGPGGPILVISTALNPYSRYTVEILRTEGLNFFAAEDISDLSSDMLVNYQVVILGEMVLTDFQVMLLTNWTVAGGTLIAFRPDVKLASLLGLTPAIGSPLREGYILVDTSSGPGVGIVGETIQYHGEADLYVLINATAVAMLYSNATTATPYPAATSREVDVNGGKAIAFTYDLAKSVVYTRQGNPAWAGQKRDGQIPPIRSDDQFFSTNLTVEPHWIDFDKVEIPQADEQQRLLANAILLSNLNNNPLPRFWYLPRKLKAAIIMTGDNHGDYGMEPRFAQYVSQSIAGCSVDNWECVRATG